jgi:BirA family biotin operon repressor/biotin-[acetyl-CoA-carboxylase] ligase
MNFTIIRYDSIDSTNAEALRQARSGASEGLCVIAAEQTAGRGRLGRQWVSEKDAGLYLSIVLRPTLETDFLSLITLMAGVAVSDTLSEIGLRPDIKWVNDILIGERKICGILAEAAETAGGLAVIVGIGINIRVPELGSGSSNTPTSVNEALGRKAEVDQIVATLLDFVRYFYDILQSENGPANIIEEWRRRSTYFSGKRVSVSVGEEVFAGTTNGLDEHGGLRVKTDDGGVKVIRSGDVERLRAIS